MEASYADIWRQAVEDLALRNGGVEVSAWTEPEHGGVVPRYRTRLLATEPSGAMVIERPGVSTQLEIGAEVKLVLVHEAQRWEGRCRIIEGAEHALNAEAHVQALRLTPPAEVRSGQRRQFFRVNVASGEVEVTLLAALPAAPVGDGQTPLSFVPGPVEIETTLVNLSGGGLGASVDVSPRVIACLKATRDFRCEINLPGLAAPLDVAAKLIHLEPLANHRAYLGLSFRFENATEERRVQDAIVRFATELQRQQLRRQRGA